MGLAEYGGHLQHIYGFKCLHANDNVCVCYYEPQPGNGGISADAALWRFDGGGTGSQGDAAINLGAPLPAGGDGGDAGHPDATEVWAHKKMVSAEMFITLDTIIKPVACSVNTLLSCIQNN